MNLLLILRVSFSAAASYKTFLRNGSVSLNGNTSNIMIRGFATGNLESEMSQRSRRSDCVTFNTLICEMCKAEGLNRSAELLDQMRREKGSSSTNETYRLFNEMVVNGFSPSSSSAVTLNDVVCGFLRIGEMGDSVNYNTLISEMSKADELSNAVEFLDHMWWVKGLTPNEIAYTSLIDSLCKHDDRIDEAYKVLSEMIVSGFHLPVYTAEHVFLGFLRTGEIGKAKEMRNKFMSRIHYVTYTSLLESLSDEVTYTSLMNAYFDEGKCDDADQLHYEMTFLDSYLHGCPRSDLLPKSVLNSVFINGLDKKARTTNTMRYLLKFNYDNVSWWVMPILEYRRTLAVNCSDDEFKSLVELVKGYCNRGLENIAYDTMLNWNYKPDGIVYNLFIIEHCKCHKAIPAYNIYKEMVYYGFDCHMFTVFALIRTLYTNSIVNELHWVIQNVLRSCNLNDSEILKTLTIFNPDQPDCEVLGVLFHVLAEKAKDGLYLKCSHALASA